MKVLAIGDVNVDFILPFRMPKIGEQVIVCDFQIHGGGCAANFAIACAKLGAQSKLVGRVARDQFGKFVVEKLSEAGVDVQDVVVSEKGKTGVTFALVGDAERSFITYRGENAIFSSKDIDIKKVSANLVHLPSFFLLEKLQPSYPQLIDSFKSAGALISFETGWDPFGWRPSKLKAIKKILRSVDIFLPNLSEAERIIGGSLFRKGKESLLARELLDFGVKVVAIKEGAKGCFVYDGSNAARIPAFKVKVVDTTGAGDVFDAAFLLEFLRGHDVLRAGKFANAAAAISVTGAGWSRYPTLNQVNKFLHGRL